MLYRLNRLQLGQPFASMVLAVSCLTSTAIAQATDGPPPGQVVIQIDPARDLVATKPGWSRVVETPGPRGTTGCLERHIQHSAPQPLNPFTVSEVTTLARTSKRLEMVRTPAGPIPMVRTSGGKLVMVSAYAAQLTDMEKFLNIFGRSLRERGLDLGRIAALRDADLSAGCKLKANLYEPVWRNPRMPVAELIKDWKMDDEVPGWLTNIADLRRLEARNQQPVPPMRGALRSITSDTQAMEQLQNRKALLSIRASDMAPPAAQAAKRLQNNPVFSASRAENRPALVQLKRGRIAGTLDFEINGQQTTTSTLQGNCENVIDFGSANEGISLNGPGRASSGGTGAQETKAPFVKTEGAPSNCLNDGSFALSMQPWKGCIATGGSLNNWFGGASCVSIASQNTGNNGVMAFENTMDMGASMTIFGVNMDLLGVHASASSSTTAGVSQPAPTVSGLVASAGGTTCCEPIAGPSLYVPIGPTGLLVTSALNIQLNAGDMKTAAKSVPTTCAAGPVPVVSINGKATAQAKAQFEASMTVLIASAGIGGEISLLGGELAGNIDTTADMGNNLVTVQPRIQFVSDIGSGQVYVFVEVDMLVYSKRWSLTLAEWEAYKTTKTFPHEPGTVRASRAQSSSMTCSAAGS